MPNSFAIVWASWRAARQDRRRERLAFRTLLLSCCAHLPVLENARISSLPNLGGASGVSSGTPTGSIATGLMSPGMPSASRDLALVESADPAGAEPELAGLQHHVHHRGRRVLDDVQLCPFTVLALRPRQVRADDDADGGILDEPLSQRGIRDHTFRVWDP